MLAHGCCPWIPLADSIARSVPRLRASPETCADVEVCNAAFESIQPLTLSTGVLRRRGRLRRLSGKCSEHHRTDIMPVGEPGTDHARFIQDRGTV